MPNPDRLIHEFEGKRLTTYLLGNEPCWIARHVGALLGYSHRGKRFVNQVTGDWSADLIPGHDYDLLQGDALADFRDHFQHGDDGFPAHARSLVVLYEPGLHLALHRTGKAVGRRLRRFVAGEVLPQLTRIQRGSAGASANGAGAGAGGANANANANAGANASASASASADANAGSAGSVKPGVEPVEPVEPRAEDAETAEPRAGSAEEPSPHREDGSSGPRTIHLQLLPPLLLDLHAARERRLLRQAMLAEARFRSASLRQTIYTLRELGRISDDTLHAYEVRAAEIALGQDLVDLRPAGIDTWESPEEIAERLGVSPRRVWRAIARLWIRGDLKDMVHSAGRRPTGDGRDSFVFLYPPGDVECIEQELCERDEARGDRA